MKKTTNRWISLGILALLVAGVVLYRTLWSGGGETAAAGFGGGGGRETLSVQGIVVGINPLAFTMDAITTDIIPDESVDLSFETSGKITRIHFSEDTAVKKGDMLAKIDDAPLQAELRKLEAQMELSNDRLYRQQALLERDAVSREAYEQARTELEMLRADIDLVKANIDKTELRAPFDGQIGFRNVSEGAWASPTTVVARLVKIVPLKLQFSFPEKYFDAVKKGTKIKFTVENSLDVMEAEVYAVASEVDQATRQIAVRATYANPGGRMVPGRLAKTSVTLYEQPDAITIPSQAIIPEMGMDKVFVYRSGRAGSLSIEAGQRTDSHVEVLKGLAPGDTLITTGTLQLREGLPVKLENL